MDRTSTNGPRLPESEVVESPTRVTGTRRSRHERKEGEMRSSAENLSQILSEKAYNYHPVKVSSLSSRKTMQLESVRRS